jgi:hypothetical protein
MTTRLSVVPGRMISDLDIQRAAVLMVRQHGERAEVVAAERMLLMQDREDHAGCRVWERIRRAIIDLQAGPGGAPSLTPSGRPEAAPSFRDSAGRIEHSTSGDHANLPPIPWPCMGNALPFKHKAVAFFEVTDGLHKAVRR